MQLKVVNSHVFFLVNYSSVTL